MSRNKKTEIDKDMLVPAVGAMIYASDEPVPPKELAGVLDGIPVDEVKGAIERFSDCLREAGVGLEVEQIAGGYRLATRSDVGPWVRRFFQQRNRTRLSPAGLETLAIVAYRQPVTAPEIQAIRGKDPSASLKSLLDKKMIRILGKKKVVGNPLLYGTRKQFLVHFGLNSLSDLPSVDDFDEFLGALESDQGKLFQAGEEAPEAEATLASELETPDGALDDPVTPDTPDDGAGASQELEAEESLEVVETPLGDPLESDSRAAEEIDLLSRVPDSEESH